MDFDKLSVVKCKQYITLLCEDHLLRCQKLYEKAYRNVFVVVQEV
ncbi:hypothetical protein [Ehrlichia minasensis]|nr:hypothetical protein [Ehrlichia minasensis]